MRELTERQKDVATFISTFIKQNNYAPSVRDIADHFKFSVKAAHDHLKALEAKQVIKTTGGISRSIEVIGQEFFPREEMIQVPLIGSIAAGKPLMSEENTEYVLSLPATMLRNTRNTYFALKVRGESMIDEGIFDGDIAIIKKCEVAETGEIIAATVGEDEPGITLKGYYPSNGYIELRPANASMGPIITRSCKIHGKLHLLIRTYA
ncbi:transcriptional repressor LexA [Sphaerochaeta globosa]|uniref:SOS-response transcriptional repressor, LexA n=1 Tax=Sphaerochaeta globosa (strain ATCC BAA-1886 / DSM 22777 / Buddy) TaxID=158189 RepID=F0RYA6_SPHGB|nr:transcriptional repressor LexA [Sphaerochaeta globosa]ADY12605.1 SOS-response transcriptional repressor, LexA [Sphaerochaeta globosa str. Buddy]